MMQVPFLVCVFCHAKNLIVILVHVLHVLLSVCRGAAQERK